MKASFREVKPDSFIYALDNALDDATCADITKRFERNPDQQYLGRLGQNADMEQSIKRSTDLRISGRSDWTDIDGKLKQSLSLGLSLVAGIHPFFQANRLHDIGYNIQRSDTGEFYHWHVDSGPGEFTKRQLVAIWYLNQTSGEGGETEFFHQQVSVQPTPGMLLLFPPFWTHLHRGNTVKSGVKYIATTWVCLE